MQKNCWKFFCVEWICVAHRIVALYLRHRHKPTLSELFFRGRRILEVYCKQTFFLCCSVHNLWVQWHSIRVGIIHSLSAGSTYNRNIIFGCWHYIPQIRGCIPNIHRSLHWQCIHCMFNYEQELCTANSVCFL